MDTKQKKLVRWLTIGFVTLTFVLVCVLFYQFLSIGNLNREQDRLDNYLLSLNDQTQDYEDVVDKMKDYNFLEDYARDNGWSTNGNIHFQ